MLGYKHTESKKKVEFKNADSKRLWKRKFDQVWQGMCCYASQVEALGFIITSLREYAHRCEFISLNSIPFLSMLQKSLHRVKAATKVQLVHLVILVMLAAVAIQVRLVTLVPVVLRVRQDPAVCKEELDPVVYR